MIFCRVGRSTTVSASAWLGAPAIVAVMSALPAATASSRPQASTAATAGAEDVHAASHVTSTVVPSESNAEARASPGWPITNVAGPYACTETMSIGSPAVHGSTQA